MKCEKFIPGGFALATNSDGKKFFFWNALPGETVAEYKITKDKSSYAEAIATVIENPSSHRVEPKDSHFLSTSPWQILEYEYELEQKSLLVQEIFREHGIDIEPPEIATDGKDYFYRNKMEYTFSNKKWRTWEEIKSCDEFKDSSNALGFHIPGAFDKVLHINKCHLQNELGDEIRNWVYDYAEQNQLSFYDIKNQKGLLRTMMIRIASTGEVMVCMVFGEDDAKAIERIMSALSERFPSLTSLLYVVNLKVNDTIGDQDVVVFKGRDYINESMEGLQFRVNAKSFYQTNSLQAYELYKVARSFAGLDKEIEENKRPLVYDLYTGTGTIANFVAKNCRQVIGIEYVPEAIEDAKLNSKVNNLDNTLFYAGDMKDILTNEFVERHGKPDIMIIDPPRAGMHEDVINVIMNTEPDVLVYVSCNPATQARDLSMLDSKYKVTDVQPVDMFPHTHHVENVVRLIKR